MQRRDVIRSEIQKRVRELIRSHQLGCESSPQIWAGTDGKKPCAACGQPIPKGTVEYEAVLGKRALHFHLECYAVWREECRT